jgi:hypothetical protein
MSADGNLADQAARRRRWRLLMPGEQSTLSHCRAFRAATQNLQIVMLRDFWPCSAVERFGASGACSGFGKSASGPGSCGSCSGPPAGRGPRWLRRSGGPGRAAGLVGVRSQHDAVVPSVACTTFNSPPAASIRRRRRGCRSPDCEGPAPGRAVRVGAVSGWRRRLPTGHRPGLTACTSGSAYRTAGMPARSERRHGPGAAPGGVGEAVAADPVAGVPVLADADFQSRSGDFQHPVSRLDVQLVRQLGDHGALPDAAISPYARWTSVRRFDRPGSRAFGSVRRARSRWAWFQIIVWSSSS